MADDLGGFFFNVQKWRGSNAVRRMSFAERGVYVEMMCEQWEKRNLPDNPQAVAEAIATTAAQVEEVLEAWTVVRAKFVTSKGNPDRIYNVPLEDTRRAQRANRRARQEAGRVAGKASAAKRLTAQELAVNERSTNVDEPSTNVNREEKSREVLKREAVTGGDESAAERDSASSSGLSPFLLFPVIGSANKTWLLSEAQVAEWVALFPGLDIRGEARKALAWLYANPGRQKTAKGMGRFLVAWFGRVADRGGSRPMPATDGPTLSPTARHNLAASEAAERLILDAEERRASVQHGHRR